MITADDLRTHIGRIKFRGGLALWRPELTVLENPMRVRVLFHCAHKELPEPATNIDDQIYDEAPVPPMLEEATALQWVLAVLEVMVVHEIQESVWVDGRQVFNPHHKIVERK